MIDELSSKDTQDEDEEVFEHMRFLSREALSDIYDENENWSLEPELLAPKGGDRTNEN